LGDKNRSVNTANGVTDKRKIAENFATYFSQVCINTSAAPAAELKADYDRIRSTKIYYRFPTDTSFRFDAKLVESVICRIKLGKAAGLHELSAEHLRYCSISLPCILAKLFNLMLFVGCAPTEFQKFTVPVLQAARQRNPCVNGDTSFLWESETF